MLYTLESEHEQYQADCFYGARHSITVLYSIRLLSKPQFSCQDEHLNMHPENAQQNYTELHHWKTKSPCGVGYKGGNVPQEALCQGITIFGNPRTMSELILSTKPGFTNNLAYPITTQDSGGLQNRLHNWGPVCHMSGRQPQDADCDPTTETSP